jgi:archaemetzincin
VPAPPHRRRLEIVPVGGVSVDVLEPVLAALDERLGTVSAVAAPLEPAPEWRAGRSRLHSAAVLDALLARSAEARDGAWRLAVAGESLHAPEVGRVFGEAAVGGGCAVMGLGALGRGKRSAGTRWAERALKVCMHEVAHAAGLDHCANPRCVMYPSRDMADTDRKAADFCAPCAERFSHATLDAWDT